MDLEPAATDADERRPRELTQAERDSLATATRMRVLEEAGLLGDPFAVRAESLDRICELVIRSVDAPTAHVSIVSAEDQRYAGAVNVHASIDATNAVDHDHSWCKFVAVDRQPLVVEDASRHPYTADSPAIGDFGARAYAGVPLITSDGASLGALCAIDTKPHRWSEEDIDTLSRLAEWVVMEVELRRRVLELERADRLKDDLVSMVAHELRSPLTTVVGSAMLLDTSWEQLLEEQRRDMAALMHRHGKRVGRLMEDLHTMVRVDAGAIAIEIEDVPLDEAVESAMEDALVLGAMGDVDVPAELVVRADRGRTEQIIINLLTNAAKYGAAPICVDAERRGDEVHLRVTDSGPGVPEDFAPRLFDRFARAPGTAESVPGSGLGLPIVRGFAREMGGDVRYVPPNGDARGACFVVVLPAA